MDTYEQMSTDELRRIYANLKAEADAAWRKIGGLRAMDHDQNSVINAFAPDLAEIQDELKRRAD